MASLARTIFEEHLVRGELVPGQEIGISVDQTLVQDATGTMAMMQFEMFGKDRVQVDTAVVYVDHNILQIDFKNPDDHRFLQAMSAKYGAWFSRPGNGICHYIHCERFAKPGKTLVGADSHTTQSGSCAMIAIGAGGLDVAVCMAGHPFELPCPKFVGVFLEGELQRPWVQAKDIILKLLQEKGVRGGRGWLFEFTGPGVATLSYTERGTIANMIAELGATGAIFPSDDRRGSGSRSRSARTTSRRCRRATPATSTRRSPSTSASSGRWSRSPRAPATSSRSRRSSGRRSRRSASAPRSTPPTTTWRSSAPPCAASACRRTSCRPRRRPGSRQILDQITRSGTYVDLLMAGIRMLEPACGPCVGMGQAPPSGANSLRTFNRNFPGRSGTADDKVYLCSPAVAAASMLKGEIADPRELPVPEHAGASRGAPRGRPGAHPRARAGRGGRVDRDPARAEHQASARAEGAAGHARAEGADRRAGRHLDRRPLAGRGDRDGVPLERPGDRRVHVPAPRPGVPAPCEGVGRRLHRRRRTTTVRGRAASTRRWPLRSWACAP